MARTNGSEIDYLGPATAEEYGIAHRSEDARLFYDNGGVFTGQEQIVLKDKSHAFDGVGDSESDEERERKKKREKDENLKATLAIVHAIELAAEMGDFAATTLRKIDGDIAEKTKRVQAIDTQMAQIGQKTASFAALENKTNDTQNAVAAAEENERETARTLDEAEQRLEEGDKLRKTIENGVQNRQNTIKDLEAKTLRDQAGHMVFTKTDKDGHTKYVDERGDDVGAATKAYIDKQYGIDAKSKMVDYNKYYNALMDTFEDGGHLGMADTMTRSRKQDVDRATTAHDRAASTLGFAKAALKDLRNQLGHARDQLDELDRQKNALPEERKALLGQIDGLRSQRKQAADFQSYLNDDDTKNGIAAGSISPTDLVKKMPEFMRADFLREHPDLKSAYEQEKKSPAAQPSATPPASPLQQQFGMAHDNTLRHAPTPLPAMPLPPSPQPAMAARTPPP